jgi:hypothetical protein
MLINSPEPAHSWVTALYNYFPEIALSQPIEKLICSI